MELRTNALVPVPGRSKRATRKQNVGRACTDFGLSTSQALRALVGLKLARLGLSSGQDRLLIALADCDSMSVWGGGRTQRSAIDSVQDDGSPRCARLHTAAARYGGCAPNQRGTDARRRAALSEAARSLDDIDEELMAACLAKSRPGLGRVDAPQRADRAAPATIALRAAVPSRCTGPHDGATRSGGTVNVSYFGMPRRRRLVEKAKGHNLCGCEDLPMTIENPHRFAPHRENRRYGTRRASDREEMRPARGSSSD